MVFIFFLYRKCYNVMILFGMSNLVFLAHFTPVVASFCRRLRWSINLLEKAAKYALENAPLIKEWKNTHYMKLCSSKYIHSSSRNYSKGLTDINHTFHLVPNSCLTDIFIVDQNSFQLTVTPYHRSADRFDCPRSSSSGTYLDVFRFRVFVVSHESADTDKRRGDNIYGTSTY